MAPEKTEKMKTEVEEEEEEEEMDGETGGVRVQEKSESQ